MDNKKELYGAAKNLINLVAGASAKSAMVSALQELNLELEEFIEGAHAALTVIDADGTVEGVALFVPKDADGKNERKLTGYIVAVMNLVVLTLPGSDTVNVIKNRNGRNGLHASIGHVDDTIRFATELE